jgi:KUP system potassium uptake protein
MAYIGQAAYISVNRDAWANPFFNCVPPHMFYPSLVIAILAAIVASQATITSAFQLLSQVMNTSYFPHITQYVNNCFNELRTLINSHRIYTSDKFHGQVYVPIANWLMMIGTVIITAVYSNTTKLGNAYGFCVILVTFITTNMVAVIALMVWKFHWTLVLAVWLPFVMLDGLYLSSAITKIPNGAWFTLLLALLLSTVFVLWRYGKEKQWGAEGRGLLDLSSFVIKQENGGWRLSDKFNRRELNSIKGILPLLLSTMV